MFHPKDHQLRWKEVPNETKSTKDSVLILLAMLLQTSNSTRTHVLLLAMLDTEHCPMTGVAVLHIFPWHSTYRAQTAHTLVSSDGPGVWYGATLPCRGES